MTKIKKIKLALTLAVLSIPSIISAEEIEGTKYIVCSDNRKFPLVFAQITSLFMTLIKIAIPILLVISGMIAFLKVTFSSNVEEDLKKAKTKLVNNIIAAVIIFFIFSIANFAVSLVAGSNSKIMKCVSCFMDSEKCENITEEGEKKCAGFLNEQGEYDENCNKPAEPKKEKPIIEPDEKDTTTPSTTTSTTTNTTSQTANEKISRGISDSIQNAQGIIGRIIGRLTGNIPGNSNLTSENGLTYADGILIVNKTYDLPAGYNPGGLTKETQNAFNEMQADASALGLNIYISSGFRSYSYQQQVYQSFVDASSQKSADERSARPGHSEHQTGLAFDLNTIDDKFANTPEGKWVAQNCQKYGLIIRYPKGKQSITGYKYEPWHLRYVGKELAQKLYNNGNWITLEEYFGITSKYKD